MSTSRGCRSAARAWGALANIPGSKWTDEDFDELSRFMWGDTRHRAGVSFADGAVVADTQVLVWYLTAPERLSATASGLLEAAVAAGAEIVVLSVSLVELVYAAEKPRDPLSAEQRDGILPELE